MSQSFLIVLLCLALLVLAVVAFGWWRATVRIADISEGLAGNAEGKDEMAAHMAALMRAQGEITGHVRGLSERLDGFGHRIGQSMTETSKNTHESLAKLGERLAVIDKAQQTITTLSGQVVELQHVLANKQTRGAFGQGRMEAIVKDGLPIHAYAFQATLGNGTRPDCVILFPTGPSLVIDAKFPLEAWNGIRNAGTPEAIKAAETQFRRDTTKHIQDIADRYFVPGETQDTAFMFVPSESIFADIHERFEDVVQRAHRSRIVIVSPSLLMLSIQVVTSLLRDQRMREQAHVIQEEVSKMMEDVGRLDERVKKLQMHFGQANKDIDDILVSTRRVTARGGRIEQVEFTGDSEAMKPKPVAPAKPAPRNGNAPPELPFSAFEEAPDTRG
jgi:DNA recombination protein RmuC